MVRLGRHSYQLPNLMTFYKRTVLACFGFKEGSTARSPLITGKNLFLSKHSVCVGGRSISQQKNLGN